jgi:hypothetical protein
MKIKTLAIAAATLAVGAITSQAQVYSQNIVGYVNVIYPAGTLILSANPLTTGNDVLTNVIGSGTGLIGTPHLYHWNNVGWDTYTWSGAQKKWLNGVADVSNTNISPGQAFFINASVTFTNTYSGTIVANTGGGTATNALHTGYTPIGELVPYGDTLTNSSTVNLTVGGASSIQIWDNVAQAYQPVYTYSGAKKTWLQGAVTNVPVLSVGQGFFINPNVNTNWVQTLQ